MEPQVGKWHLRGDTKRYPEIGPSMSIFVQGNSYLDFKSRCGAIGVLRTLQSGMQKHYRPPAPKKGAKWAYEPGSVVDDHLSTNAVTGAL